MPKRPLKGGFHCRTLRYRVTALPRIVYNCHCTNCRRIGGGAFATNLVIKPDSFEFLQGDPRK